MGKPTTAKVAAILKLVTIVVGLVATAVGCAAHYNSAAKTLWDEPGSEDACKLILDYCPTNAISMERIFVGVTIICLILSTVSVVAGFLMDLTSLRTLDGFYHELGGILVLIAGILMITSAVQIDNHLERVVIYIIGYPCEDECLKELRQQVKYDEKLIAGGMAILNGIIYWVTAGVIFQSK